MSRRRRVVSAVMFSPRGGSAHVARALAANLPAAGWDVTLVAGSRTDQGPEADATQFYEELDVIAVDFTAALAGPRPSEHRGAPGEAPMHPSFEDRPGAPDPIFASLSDEAFEVQVAAWERALEAAGAAAADVLHLHHLTPLNEAARRVAPDVPIVGQLHGTELLMLEAIEAGASWPHAESWRERMREWARRCRHLFVAPAGIERATRLLDVEDSRIEPMPNGFEPQLFRRLDVDRAELWRRRLVEEPRGWVAGEPPGSARYEAEEIRPLIEGVALLYIGRFTEVKRLPLLIEAFSAASERFEVDAGLVLLGGHPDEWEGPHPADVVEATGARSVFLAGWYGHDRLPEFLAASDLVVLASAREQFGQVLVEGMACGVPPVASESLGPSMIVEDGETGWLVALDDPGALAGALVEAVNDRAERERRGARAREAALEQYSWPGIAARAAEVFETVVA